MPELDGTGRLLDPHDMRLLSWNVNARTRVLRDQIDAVLARRPDVVALQEVTIATRAAWRSGLTADGFRLVMDSFEMESVEVPLRGPRRYGVLIATRYPAEPLKAELRLRWPERFLGASVRTSTGPVDVFTTHIPPGSSNGWTKVEMLEGVYESLACYSAVPRVLTGDFNAPQAETPDGDVITWGQEITQQGDARIWGAWKGGTGTRWDAAERNVLTGLGRHDLVDVFRSLHGWQRREYSWYLRRKERRVGRRFDHIFASAALRPIECAYIHDWRESGLSDHSAIEARFAGVGSS